MATGRPRTVKRVWLGWSSGKDSAWTIHLLRQDPEVEILALLTTLNGAVDRVAMHGVRRRLVEAQAERLGLPLRVVHLPDPCSNAEYERLMAAEIEEARAQGVTHMAFGDLFLEDVRAYRQRQLADTGIQPLFPAWGAPQETAALARRMIDAGIRAVITCVDTEQLDPRFLGRDFDEALLAELPASVDPCGEKGEFHTFAFAAPDFHGDIEISRGEIVRRERFHFMDLS